MFDTLSEKELVDRRKNALDRGDNDTLTKLEVEAAVRIDRFLTQDFYLDSDDAPFFYTFLHAFADTQNTALKMQTKRAEVKLVPLLKQFDSENGLDIKTRVSSETIERNLNDIAIFERENLRNMSDFRQIYKILDQTEQVDDDGNVSDSEDLAESLEEAAKLKTCLRLCLNSDKLSRNEYFSTLRTVFEVLIVTLFLMDKASDVPLDEEKVRMEFDKLLDAIDET